MPPNPPQGHRYVPREESPLEALRRERDALAEEREGLRRAIALALSIGASPFKSVQAQTPVGLLEAALRGEFPP